MYIPYQRDICTRKHVGWGGGTVGSSDHSFPDLGNMYVDKLIRQYGPLGQHVLDTSGHYSVDSSGQ